MKHVEKTRNIDWISEIKMEKVKKKNLYQQRKYHLKSLPHAEIYSKKSPNVKLKEIKQVIGQFRICKSYVC